MNPKSPQLKDKLSLGERERLAGLLRTAKVKAMQEGPGAVLENLDRAEKLGLLSSADEWLAIRKLRNLMVHEYIDHPQTLHMALHAAHAHVAMLAQTVEAFEHRTSPLLG